MDTQNVQNNQNQQNQQNQQAAQQEPVLKLELTVSEVNLLMQALGEIPMKVAIGVWTKIKAQGEAQLSQQAPVVVSEDQPE